MIYKLQHKIKTFFALLFCICINTSNANTIKIGILALQKPTSIDFKGLQSGLEIYEKRAHLFSIPADSVITTACLHDSVVVSLNGHELGRYKKLKLIAGQLKQGIAVAIITPRKYESTYTGGITITASNRTLHLINYADIEDYVAGTVESESGTKQPLEFLKVQTLICRTYALSHLKRHDNEGFSLCDQTHCQVYRGKASNAKIINATIETQQKIIIDSTLTPISAAFHANCGGKTRNSEDEWNNSMSYLRAVKDTFCIHTPNAHWQKLIQRQDWLSYLKKKDSTLVLDTIANDSSFNRVYIAGEVYYTYKNVIIPYKKIRTDWKLKSTQFGITQQHDTLAFNGLGYGHGVGLCQDGAIQMAARGYSCADIINFYYYHVAIVDSDALTIITDPE